jgi:hypothetical protein
MSKNQKTYILNILLFCTVMKFERVILTEFVVIKSKLFHDHF